MFGKMSVGIVSTAIPPRIAINTRHNDKGVGPAKREPDNPHTTRLLELLTRTLEFPNLRE